MGRRTDLRVGWLTVMAGLALALAAQVHAPVRAPLFDGVVVQEPYRYLHPNGDQPGNPTSYEATLDVAGGVSPIVAAATTENPPQVQLIAQKNAFELPPGVTSLQVSITPIERPPAPVGSTIAGNVYRLAVTGPDGTALAIRACDGCISVTLRGPEDVGEGTLQRYAAAGWVAVTTIHVPLGGAFQTNPTVLGDFALIVGGADEQAQEGTLQVLVVLVGVAVVLLVLAMGFLFFRVRSEPAVEQSSARRLPSKRRRPRRPPGGRPNE